MPSDVLAIWKSGLQKGIRALIQRQQYRSLAEIHGVNFCSNDYLGLAGHPTLHAAVSIAVQESRHIGGTGSRLLSGQTDEWRDLESRFASFAGTEAALYFTTGYAANLGLLSSLVTKDDVIFSDALNHASLIDGMRLSGARKVIYPHLDLQVLEDALRQEAGAPWRKVIVTETVFSMDGDVAPIKEIATLAEKYGAALIVDEAHATAVHGPCGRGIAAQADIIPQLLAVIHTCGKGLGSAGAFVCGPSVLKEHLINHARTFIFSTALPSYFARQISAALDLSATMDFDRQELLGNAALLIHDLRGHGFDTAASASQIVPVILGGNEDTLAAAEYLQQEGFGVRAVRPPTVPEGRSRIRLSLTTLVDQQKLTHLVDSLVAWRAHQQSTVAAKHA